MHYVPAWSSSSRSPREMQGIWLAPRRLLWWRPRLRSPHLASNRLGPNQLRIVIVDGSVRRPGSARRQRRNFNKRRADLIFSSRGRVGQNSRDVDRDHRPTETIAPQSANSRFRRSPDWTLSGTCGSAGASPSVRALARRVDSRLVSNLAMWNYFSSSRSFTHSSTTISPVPISEKLWRPVQVWYPPASKPGRSGRYPT